MAATYTLQTAVIVPGYVTVTTLTPNEIVVGASITVAGAGAAYNGVKSVYAMPQYLPINVDTEGLIEYDTSYPLENAVMWADTQTPDESSYIDSLTTSPGGDVTLGTLMYGSALYRQRGSVDQFASFTDMASAPTVGLSGIVKQLLGINRPQVA